MSEPRLAIHLQRKTFPCIGDTVKFLSDHELGTAKVLRFRHNGYNGHLELTDFNNVSSSLLPESSSTDLSLPASSSTDSLLSESSSVDSSLSVPVDINVSLQHDLLLIESEQQNLSDAYALLETKKANIHRRMSGKPVQLKLSKRSKKTSTANVSSSSSSPQVGDAGPNDETSLPLPKKTNRKKKESTSEKSPRRSKKARPTVQADTNVTAMESTHHSAPPVSSSSSVAPPVSSSSLSVAPLASS